jgi:hypothetical protein
LGTVSEFWWSIEVLNGAYPAEQWRAGHYAALVEAALTRGAVDFSWHPQPWGVVLEFAFRDSDAWVVYRQLPAVTAALDAVPDPVNGLMIYQGRGGSSASSDRRRPRPRAGAGAAPIPQEPEPILVARLG